MVLYVGIKVKRDSIDELWHMFREVVSVHSVDVMGLIGCHYHQMLLNSLCVLNLRLMQEFVIEKRFFIM
jgi:hypothetical protein